MLITTIIKYYFPTKIVNNHKIHHRNHHLLTKNKLIMNVINKIQRKKTLFEKSVVHH